MKLFKDVKENHKQIILNTLPVRTGDVNKGDFGRALIVCGSYGMAGAAILAAKAALKCGVGICELFVPSTIYNICAVSLPECVFTIFNQEESPTIISDKLISRLNCATACLIGCGLSKSKTAENLVNTCLENCKCPLIIDADGLNIISNDVDSLLKIKCKAAITPHAAEMGRLTKKAANTVNSSREQIATNFAAQYNIDVLLKGQNTVISLNNGNVFVNPTGNAGMAKGGSGDVLSGIIVSLSAQTDNIDSSLITGAYIHGLAGDIAKDKCSARAMGPLDIISSLNDIFKGIEA